MFGEESVPKAFSGDRLEVVVDSKRALIDVSTLKVDCDEDDCFEQIVQTATSKLWHSLMPAMSNLGAGASGGGGGASSKQ